MEESPNEWNTKVGDFEAPNDLSHRKLGAVGRTVAPGVGIAAAQGTGCSEITAALKFLISQVFCCLVLLSPGYLTLSSVPSSVVFPGRSSCKDEFKTKQPV